MVHLFYTKSLRYFQNYYRLQAKLNICVKYTVHKTQLAENKNREIKNKLRAKLRMKKNFQC
jgi:hypothetical protein